MNVQDLAGVVLALLAFVGPVNAAPSPYTNRLAGSADPYLLEHAHNPVDWYPWGPEAFAKAKAEDKPIFLSVGYSTCYWCHVAEKTIYSDPAIAKLMNEWFVNVKVDREELPDVDRLYMDATSMLNGRGAWPNNLFLTPAGAPFYAGSYFPPKDDAGTPGFPTVLAAIHDLWANHRAENVTPAADEMMAALRKLADRETAPVPLAPRAWLASGAEKLLAGIDPQHGGLGRAGPKFPQAPALTMLGAAARLVGNDAAGAALRKTLDAMAYGGIQDQLAGGFFRYATDASWSVPHFEKMLTDNAQLLALYAAGTDPLERETARGIVRFLLRDMQLPGGGFATALDAQTGGVEGGTYLWTRAEIEAVLGAPDAARFLSSYELTPLPQDARPLGPPPGVLRVRVPIVEPPATLAELAPLRERLLNARAGRAQPARDDKIVAGWNGLAIGALARAGKALQEPEALAAATGAALLLWTKAYDPATGELKHQMFAGTAAVPATPEDYAALADGYLDLAEAGGGAVWRERAVGLADAMLARFLRADGSLKSDAGLLPLALGDDEDADLPSGTSDALDLLGRLAEGVDGARFGRAQARIAGHLSGSLAARPTVWPSAVVALAEHPPDAAAVAATASPPKASAPAKVAGPPSPHVPATADHVHATMTSSPDAGMARVTLSIDAGWHVNAHVPSLDYLVPTDLAFKGVVAGAVTYPASRVFQPGFASQPLSVYEGDVTLSASLPKGASGWSATVTAQACDAHTCLPPSTIPVERR